MLSMTNPMVNMVILNLMVKMNAYLFQEVGVTQAGAFWVFGGITILTFFFCLLFVPETKGKSLDDIQQLFRSPRPYFLEIDVWRLFGSRGGHDEQRPILEEVY